MTDTVDRHAAVCDECGATTTATTHALASGVTCEACATLPPWP
ncbi:hypothetical protein [Haloglomus irregulare]|nr:hypothetical protein [Haloglomus irregulare]